MQYIDFMLRRTLFLASHFRWAVLNSFQEIDLESESRKPMEGRDGSCKSERKEGMDEDWLRDNGNEFRAVGAA